MYKKQQFNANDLMVSGTMMNVGQPRQIVQRRPSSNLNLIKKRVSTQPIPKKIPILVQPIPLPVIKEVPIQVPVEPQYSIISKAIMKQESAPVVYSNVMGEVTVRYSHYKDKFSILDGVLMEQAVDQQYCLSFVFKGNYQFQLRLESDKQHYLSKAGGGWVGLQDGKVYVIEVDEDPEQLALEALTNKKFVAYEARQVAPQSTQVKLITQELRDMSLQELEEKGPKYRQLIEARDLEDILFS